LVCVGVCWYVGVLVCVGRLQDSHNLVVFRQLHTHFIHRDLTL